MSKSSTTVSSRCKVKMVFLGDQSAGKTSIIDRYINDTFRPSQDPTVGVDFLGKNVAYNNRQFRLQLWDTAGQERFRSLVPNYLRDAACAVFVFDLANEQTIGGLTKWIQLFEDNKKQQSIAILCGNKKDLQNSFDRTKIQHILDKYAIPFIEVSALSGEGVNTLFETAINELSAKTSLSTSVIQGDQPFGITDKPFVLPQLIPPTVFQSKNDRLFCSKPKSRCC